MKLELENLYRLILSGQEENYDLAEQLYIHQENFNVEGLFKYFGKTITEYDISKLGHKLEKIMINLDYGIEQSLNNLLSDNSNSFSQVLNKFFNNIKSQRNDFEIITYESDDNERIELEINDTFIINLSIISGLLEEDKSIENEILLYKFHLSLVNDDKLIMCLEKNSIEMIRLDTQVWSFIKIREFENALLEDINYLLKNDKVFNDEIINLLKLRRDFNNIITNFINFIKTIPNSNTFIQYFTFKTMDSAHLYHDHFLPSLKDNLKEYYNKELSKITYHYYKKTFKKNFKVWYYDKYKEEFSE